MTSRQQHSTSVNLLEIDGMDMQEEIQGLCSEVDNDRIYNDMPEAPQSHIGIPPGSGTSKMKQNHWPFIINLGNSIIGVSVLAMPFCFKQCGIILGALLLLGSAWLTNVSCNLLMKAAITSKRRSYEFLALQTFGAAGKLAVEVCIIGLLIGTCIAFYVVIGDLGPLIISKVLQVENNQTLRVSILMVLAVIVVTPLGLLRSIESLSNISAISIAFYLVFVVLIFFTSLPNIIEGVWLEKIVLWRTEGIFQSLPIFSMAFGCQTQLFVMYDALQEPSLKQMTLIIKGAISLCTSVYLMVGFFGYIAFYNVEIAGDVLTNLKSSVFTEVVKFGFVLSIAVSFPLCIFPCRAAIHTLLFAHEQKTSYHDNIGGSTRIPEGRFRLITMGIIICTFMVGVVVPNVEFVLGLTGATMGTMICYLFPAIMFIRVMSLASNGKAVAQIVLVLGLIILFASTYTTLYSHDRTKHVAVDVAANVNKPDMPLDNIDKRIPDSPLEGGKDIKDKKDPVKDPPKLDVPKGDEKRREPPNPHAPDDTAEKKESKEEETELKPTVKAEAKTLPAPIEKGVEKEGEKEESPPKTQENKKAEAEVQNNLKKQDEILHQLAEQQQEQKKLIAEHKQLIQELKDHKKEHDKEDAVNRIVNSANADLLRDLDFKAVANKQAQVPVLNQSPNVAKPNSQNLVQQSIGQAGQQKPVVQQNVGQQPPVQNVAKQPVQNLAQQPVQNMAQQPVAQQPAQNVPQQPVGNNAQQPVQNVAQQPPQNLMQQPMKNAVQQPVQNAAQQPVQKVVKQPIPNAAQQPFQNAGQQPVQNAGQQPVQNAVQQPVKNVVQQPDQNAAQLPVQKIARQPVQNVVQQPVKNIAQQPVPNVAKQPVQNAAVQQPAQKSNVVNQNVQQPVKKLSPVAAPVPPVKDFAKQAPLGENAIKQSQNVNAGPAAALDKVVPNDPHGAKEAVKDNLK
ncbi:solute carrier family 38 member 10-like isoform X2 [Lineus longissimus]|uniref:solute carrier family 38 member 10-like isoform X2 n=1 Tax=Lineus longissimus TaxID=88925 RepID=UPI00315D495C